MCTVVEGTVKTERSRVNLVSHGQPASHTRHRLGEGRQQLPLMKAGKQNAFKPTLTTTFKKLFFWVCCNYGIPQIGKMSKDIKGSTLAAGTFSKAHLIRNAWGRVKGLNPAHHEAPASGQDSESSVQATVPRIPDSFFPGKGHQEAGDLQNLSWELRHGTTGTINT